MTRSTCDAGLPRRLRIVADGVDLAAELGPRQDDVRGGHDEREDDDRHRHAEHRRGAEAQEGRVGNSMPKDSVMAVPSPRPATSVASVTRNGVIRSLTMQNGVDGAEDRAREHRGADGRGRRPSSFCSAGTWSR